MKDGTDNQIDLEALRTRLQKMSDQELLRFAQAEKFMLSAGGESRRAATLDVSH
jgi:hypothetical protein